MSNPKDDSIQLGGDKEITKIDLIMESWRTCMRNRQKEMINGYFNIKIDNKGNQQKTWVTDAREIYTNSVIAFDLLLTDDYDDKYTEAKKKINGKADTLYKKYAFREYKVNKVNKIVDGLVKPKYYMKLTGKITMPDPDSENGKVWAYGPNIKGKIVPINWTNQRNQYMQGLLYIYDELYSEIVKLLSRNDVIKGGGGIRSK